MKLFRNIILICMTAIFASCDDSETFYTITYPIVRVEVSTIITTAEPAPESTPVTTTETLIETINRKALAAAPVQTGGEYTLDFTRHNGGTLTVNTATSAGVVAGTFDKTPGKSNLTFRFAEQEYVCKTDSYTDNDGLGKVRLSIDLTQHYQGLYPDAKIESVTRLEYTSTSYK